MGLLLGYVFLRSGPLAPIAVTVTVVEARGISPSLFGIGTVEARHRFRIGPTQSGRVGSVLVDVGDVVAVGQLLATMEPIDLDARMQAQSSAVARAAASLEAARAQAEEVNARRVYARAQAERYRQLASEGLVSREAAEARKQELDMAEAALASAHANRRAAGEEVARLMAESGGVAEQRANLQLTATSNALVVARLAEAGSTAVAGQGVLELIDPDSLWLDLRFDQQSAAGLRSGLAADVVLRSRPEVHLPASVLRVEPLADSVTEELRAKLIFTQRPLPLPALGERIEAHVLLPETAPAPTVPNAALRRVDGTLGVWRIGPDGLVFVEVTVLTRDLEGRVQLQGALSPGDRILLHSASRVSATSRIREVATLAGPAS
ncbi:MAG: efflux RND transporter periplasmic adaptor subunit [Arenimonas sp.]|uniref:efflux RND transporter periplasmic adaptor subunit n=1 Tax=Arenimonas sp. TaxID=1872635 RepID=UPI0025C348D8|nr:efflux RND transporter periplasmic adaptor subunit [Arenimonas sp.]MBW8368394.1 efflux RND transporter periplasmic adaptor subunit [Arenimonas sp.]